LPLLFPLLLCLFLFFLRHDPSTCVQLFLFFVILISRRGGSFSSSWLFLVCLLLSTLLLLLLPQRSQKSSSAKLFFRVNLKRRFRVLDWRFRSGRLVGGGGLRGTSGFGGDGFHIVFPAGVLGF